MSSGVGLITVLFRGDRLVLFCGNCGERREKRGKYGGLLSTKEGQSSAISPG